MERRELDLGEKLDANGRFGVVLAGMLRGGRGLLRPGDTFEGSVTAITLATVATCERAVYESTGLVNPVSGARAGAGWRRRTIFCKFLLARASMGLRRTSQALMLHW